ncbi:hypothetical protein IEQ34_015572 [Dendrobium chrysotoxum]|uniref:Uncharacterized protein n=1 Tax=Dendrobium chrysotoxum TaxID=161865 RepID=A0AAV7GIB4_DENCH|nr:hypothetical protein IEQ34_015572 [Dendrobium chrysotoxum]
MPGLSDSDETIVSVGLSGSRTDLLATARRRFLPSASPNAFLTPSFTAAASAVDPSLTAPKTSTPLLRFTQSRLSRPLFSLVRFVQRVTRLLLSLRRRCGCAAADAAIRQP